MDYKNSYTYILLCNDNTLYTGYTTNLLKRITAHSQGKGAKYTKYRLPIKILYYEELNSKSQAMKLEASIKKLKKIQKLNYISQNINDNKIRIINKINNKIRKE